MNKLVQFTYLIKNKDNFIILFISLSCLTLLPLVDISRGLFVVLWVVLLAAKGKKEAVRSNLSGSYRWMFWSCIVFYLIHLAGMIYSIDKKAGFSDLSYKIPILFTPFLFVMIPKTCFTEKYQKKYIYSYLAGCLLFAGYTFISAFLRVRENPNLFPNTFFRSELGLYIHVTYISLFFVMGIVFMFYLLRKTVVSAGEKYILSGMMIFFMGYILLLGSRGGILALVTAIMAMTVSLFNTRKGRIYGLLGFILFDLTLLISVTKIEFLNKRTEETKKAIQQYRSEDQHQDIRIVLWENTIPVIKEHFWFGTGTGSKNAVMEKNIKIEEYPNLNNPHNQFLQTLIEFGFIGFLSLFSIFLIGLWLSVKEKSLLLFIFISITAANCFFESFLERTLGMTFFSVILFVIISFIYSKNQIRPVKEDIYLHFV